MDITKAGVVKASLISTDYLEELEETIFSLEHSLPEIKRAKAEIKAGRFTSLDTFLKKYASQTTPPTKSRPKKHR